MKPPTAETSATTTGSWIELDARSGDGFDISLLWSGADHQVKVTVTDRRLGVSFEFDVAGADALTAFHHPFAYVSDTNPRHGADADRPAAAPSPVRTGAPHVIR